MTARTEWLERRRFDAGLPILVCPSCGKAAAHWVAETYETPGFFTCDSKSKGTNT